MYKSMGTMTCHIHDGDGDNDDDCHLPLWDRHSDWESGWSTLDTHKDQSPQPLKIKVRIKVKLWLNFGNWKAVFGRKDESYKEANQNALYIWGLILHHKSLSHILAQKVLIWAFIQDVSKIDFTLQHVSVHISRSPQLSKKNSFAKSDLNNVKV